MCARRTSKPGSRKPVKASRPTGTANEPTQPALDQHTLDQHIADRAYCIWLERGKPENSSWDIWFEAQSQVLREHADRKARGG